MNLRPYLLVLLLTSLCLSACSATKDKGVPPSAVFNSGFEKHSPTMGDPRASVKIYLFSDFACKYCKDGSEEAKKLIMKYPSDVQVVYKHLPNGRDQGSLNAAKAARAAAVQNRFWDMHDVLFQFSRTRSEKELKDLAMILALDLNLYKEDFKDYTQEKLIQADAKLARSWGVRGTPAYFVNGIPVSGPGKLSEAVESAIRLQPGSNRSLSLR